MIVFKQKGDFKKTFKFLKRSMDAEYLMILDKYGEEGVRALSAVTPVKTGTTADSWSYRVERSRGKASIYWTNTNVTTGLVPIVILLQYGHGTGTGGYVTGQDFINPALRPVFDKIAEAVWEEVIKE